MIIRELADAIDAGTPVASATVVRTHQSVPRHPGSRMLVYSDGRTSGTIGGGEMERRVTAEAVAALADGRPRVSSYALVDPSGGDPGVCGGEVEIYVEPHMPAPILFIVGAGHVGRAVVDLAHWLGHRTVVWDDRPELLDSIEHADERHGGPIAEALASTTITAATSVVVVTRNVDLDVDLLPHILATSVGYVGLMGSHRRWDTTRAKLDGLGVTAANLDRVRSPIGIDISAETPEEIAVSILAEVIEHRSES